MSIRWVKNVIIDRVKTTIEVQIGEKRIGDKCYTRIGTEVESWFHNASDDRDQIIAQGIALIKRKLGAHTVSYPDGRIFDWSS
jgi:hypothetical protein